MNAERRRVQVSRRDFLKPAVSLCAPQLPWFGRKVGSEVYPAEECIVLRLVRYLCPRVNVRFVRCVVPGSFFEARMDSWWDGGVHIDNVAARRILISYIMRKSVKWDRQRLLSLSLVLVVLVLVSVSVLVLASVSVVMMALVVLFFVVAAVVVVDV